MTSPAEASAARLPDDEPTAIGSQITHWREQCLVLTARLAEPELQAAIAQPPADLEHAVTELNTATATHSRTAALTTQAADRATALATLTAQMDTHIQPLEDTYRTVDHLHGLISGGSPSNQLRMQLESYVLAARLEDVVDAANTRLSRMSHHRFSLVHSDDRAARGAKSGLTSLPPKPAARHWTPSSSTKASAPSTKTPSTKSSTSWTPCAPTTAPSDSSTTSPNCAAASPNACTSPRTSTAPPSHT
ncbi:hypothetical protein [Streptomyces sp. NPDC048584]|uniref:hypothetical protein n=1 Tax=Streptomyces sp. NPDC048584 TaxID=3365573 RepID=UPI00371A79A6